MEKAKTHDESKLQLAWLPWRAIAVLAKVQAFGHAKYKDFNNFRKGMEVTRNLSCAFRHMVKYMLGETYDPESGQHHLGHAMCRLAFIIENEMEGVAIDDRLKNQVIQPDLLSAVEAGGQEVIRPTTAAPVSADIPPALEEEIEALRRNSLSQPDGPRCRSNGPRVSAGFDGREGSPSDRGPDTLLRGTYRTSGGGNYEGAELPPPETNGS